MADLQCANKVLQFESSNAAHWQRGVQLSMKKLRLLLVLISLLLPLERVHALGLGYFSRACPITGIPWELRGAALVVFEAIGDAPLLSLRSLLSLSERDQSEYYIFESITADYWPIPRYYLFAESKAYRRIGASFGTGPNTMPEYGETTAHYSSSWIPETFPDEIYSDSKLSILFKNRGGIFSRAGARNIVERWPRLNPPPINPPRDAQGRYVDRWDVYGQHALYNPSNKLIVQMPSSFASDCNLTNWGFDNFKI